jgi:DNA-binding NtrC family response regulator
MRLIADRFVDSGVKGIVDLATGENVALTISSAGGPTDQLQWAARCDWFQQLFHPSLARLVDYGALGESRRFEAWRRASVAPVGQARDAVDIVRSASAFLRACGLTSLDRAEQDAQTGLIPHARDGYPDDLQPQRHQDPLPVENCGIVRVERRALGSVVELFEMSSVCGGEPQAVCIWGPDGSGKTTAVNELARAARLNGFIPVSVHLLTSPFADLLAGRAVCVMDDARSGWRFGLLDLAIRSPRAHVVICTSCEDIRGVAGVAMTRISPPALLAAIRPAHLATDPRIRRAAERASGNPGRFVRQIHGARYDPATWKATAAAVAAERAPAYHTPGSSPPRSLELPAGWPNRDDVVALRQQMAAALKLIAAGRHAPGDRALRQAIGGLARRGDSAGAVEGSLALAASLLRRGRPRDANAILEIAREHGQSTRSTETAIALAILAGAAWIDLARLAEAESVLGAVVASELARGGAAAGAALGLARCRFWRGRFSDAASTLDALRREDLDAAATIRWHALRARVAIGLFDFTRAMSSAAEAMRSAEAQADPALAAEAACAAGFAHLAVGDAASLRRDVAACVAAAKAARDPLRAVRGRLMLAEQCRRAGNRGEALVLMAELKRFAVAGVPPILRWRYDLLGDLLKAGEAVEDVVARHTAASGLPALALYGPREGHGSALTAVVDDALAMLYVCQTAEEDTAILADLCGLAQRGQEAAAVAFFGVEGGSVIRLAGSGARLDPLIARRTTEAAVPIAPHRLDDRVEAAVPVRYGGTVVGALAARWTLNRLPDASRAMSILTMAATAAAPLVQSALASRSRTETRATHDLLGVSAAMIDVRRAADRAASAPFAVLVEGESGSGKELVARAVHLGGARRDRPFRTLNCAALPDDLVESELFGHARGAFTGAVAERVGVFEEAHSGTLLLDEVGELSPRAQAKLLRVIQEGELRRIGENFSRRIDVRIVSATNRDLRQEAASGRFRLDLLYRLDVVRITMPALRDRREDIPLLVERFWREAAARVGSQAALGAAAVAALARYDWPGNVRELQNVLAALAVRVGRRGVVGPAALPPQFASPQASHSGRLDVARRAFDERFIRAALVRTGGRRAQAAAELGVSRQGLTKLMTRLGIGGHSGSVTSPTP